MKKNKANTNAARQAEVSPATAAEPKAVDPKKQAAKLRKEAKVLDTHGNSAKAAELRAQADTLDPKPAKVAKPKPEPRPVCDQKKKDGTACTARAMQGATYCTDHRPAAMHLTDAELEWLGEHTTAQLVALFGWGKVRQAYKNAHPEQKKATEQAA